MQDFEEGFAVGYLLGKRKNSATEPTERYDSIFHDILENSETFCTIIIDDVYKFTLNLWVTTRGDAAFKYRDYTNLVAVESEGVGYSQSPVVYTRHAFVYRILWKNDEPMYAAYVNNTEVYRDFPTFIDVHKNMNDALPYKYYLYHSAVSEYVKGSATPTCDPQLYIKPTFTEFMYGTKFLNLGEIKIVDSSGNSVQPGCTFKVRENCYKAEPDGYLTSPPKIVFDKTVERVGYINGTYFGDELFIFSCSDSSVGAIYSDLPETELNGLTDELIKAICEKYGDKSCYTHIPAEWLTPEIEETI